MKALVTDFAWSDLDVETSILEAHGVRVEVAPSTEPTDLVRAAEDADAILVNWARVDRALMDAATGLSIVARLGIGLDNIDVAHATRRGILVTNVPDYCVAEVADHTLALILALVRNLATFDRACRAGTYDLRGAPPMRRLEGRLLGLVGFGRTARAVALRAAGFGLRVAATTRTPRDLGDGVAWLPLDELLAQSDVVSLHCPATPLTRRILDARALARMKPTSFLVNTARGSLVDPDALAAALARGDIAGAALDVQDPEPPDLARPPWCDPRVVVTPHAAFSSSESLADLRERAATQVATALAGGTPSHVVNPEALARRRS